MYFVLLNVMLISHKQQFTLLTADPYNCKLVRRGIQSVQQPSPGCITEEYGIDSKYYHGSLIFSERSKLTMRLLSFLTHISSGLVVTIKTTRTFSFTPRSYVWRGTVSYDSYPRLRAGWPRNCGSMFLFPKISCLLPNSYFSFSIAEVKNAWSCNFTPLTAHRVIVNPLKPKRRPLYLKTQSVPRCKHFSSRL